MGVESRPPPDGPARSESAGAADESQQPAPGADGMTLTIRSGEASGASAKIGERRILLGRSADCDLVVPDPKASRRHAAVEPLPDGRATLVDLGSGNGTFVNGRRVESAELEGHEQIQVGDTVIVSSRGELPAALGTVLGPAPPSKSQSLVQRLVLQRSVRRATLISGVAVGLAVVLGLLLVTGILAPGADETRDAVERVAKAAEPSTVVIDAGHDDGGDSSGTGWVLDAGAGLIATNAHVVDGRVNLRVGVGEQLRKAKLVGISPCEDLAVLRAERTAGLRTLPLSDQSAVARGETVVALGYPADASLEANLSVTTGVVSVVRTAYRESTLDLPRFGNVIQTDAAINPGNSGGPLLDLDGKLIGVTSAGRTLAPDGHIIQGQSYAIGVDRVKRVVGVLRSGRSIGSIGASFEYLTPAGLRRRGLPPGLPIEEVAQGGPAERAGLGAGSHLVAVDGEPIDNSLASYCDAIQGLGARKFVTLSVLEPGSSRPRRVRAPLA